jgi:AraC-like DNA-binding protein
MLLSLLYFVTGLLGFVTLTIVATQYKSNRIVNGYLLILYFFISLRFFINGFNILNSTSILDKIDFKYYPFLSVIFPCVYLYFKNLVDNNKKILINDFRHFISPIFLGFVNVIIAKPYLYYNYVFHFIFAGIALFYLFLSFNKLKMGIWSEQTKIAIVKKQNKLLKNWTLFLFVVYVLSIARLLICLFINLYKGVHSSGENYLWIMAIICWVLFFKVLASPQILFGYNVLYDKINEQRNAEFVFGDFWVLSKDVKISNVQDVKLNEKIMENIITYIYDIEAIALKDDWFRIPSVTLGDFANKLGIPKSHLIFIFKYHSKISFTDLRKIVRIHDSVNLIEADYLKSNTLESLAKKVGFSSYNPFFTSFKEIVGVVPQDYSSKRMKVK